MSMKEVFGDQIDKESFGKTLSGALVLVGPQKEAGALAIKCHDHLVAALENLVNFYYDGVNSGDCSNWNPEEDQPVIEARAALKMAKCGALRIEQGIDNESTTVNTLENKPTHRPKGSMCLSCKGLSRHKHNCPSRDEFKTMLKIGQDGDGMVIVKCSKFERV